MEKTGTVKFFNEAKGYGFITVENTSEDVFVHANDLGGLKITEGDKVSFNINEGKKGTIAVNVDLV